MNKKLFFSLLLLSSAAVNAMGDDLKAAGHKMESMAENAATSTENEVISLGSKVEDMAYSAEVGTKNIFEKIKDFIMGLVHSVMNFFHGLFGG
jgi:hypothetical protein